MYEYCANRQYFVQSIIYIYIVKTFYKISPKKRETLPHTGKRGGFTEKRREIIRFTPFSCCFPSFSLDSAAKYRDFKRFRRVTEENRAFNCQFHAIYRRFPRSRSCSPCFISGRENSPKRRGAAFSFAKTPKPSPGVPLSTGERRQGKGIPPPSGRSRAGFPTKKFCGGVPFLLLRSPCVRSV